MGIFIAFWFSSTGIGVLDIDSLTLRLLYTWAIAYGHSTERWKEEEGSQNSYEESQARHGVQCQRYLDDDS